MVKTSRFGYSFSRFSKLRFSSLIESALTAARSVWVCGKTGLCPQHKLTPSKNVLIGRRLSFTIVAGRLVTALLDHLGIRREREQREILPVQVILQIEHARKSSAGEERLVPGAVFLLRAQQVGDAAGDGIAARVVGCQQS